MLDMVISARRRDLGGFEVGRVLPFMKRRMVGPFIFFDHMGPVDLPPHVPRSTDVRPHPHIGLSTVTYLFDGEIMHRDSTGARQAIRPGAVNWMTAGSGISHSERFDGPIRETGGRMHGIQAWVALPETFEETDPSFIHHGAEELPIFGETDVSARLIAGEAFGLANSVTTHSPLFYLHVELDAGARIGVPTGYPERAAYVVRGRIEADGHPYEAGQMLVFAGGDDPVLRALEPTTVMLLGGEPLGPRHIWWNFVSSRKDRIEQAKADWQAGRIRLPLDDDREFIPLPEEPRPSPEPMS
ncbi:pirin family protein [Microvirga lenta]|uniref:pirin family protein n=1 Tax=Microvirga lenta TaxID=2881337 RepID=UPI001CFFFECB|nr:pirin family protein [Microvirga lenta]MCB5176413.1 pirin family protein [Microvirga lenta]